MPLMDTGRATVATAAIMGSRPTPVPMQAAAAEDPQKFLRDLAKHLAVLSNGNGNGGPPRKFLGLDTDRVWSKVVYGAVIGVMWLSTWYMSVNQGLEDRPTVKQMESRVEAEVIEKVTVHSQQVAPHPGIERQLRDISDGQEATDRKIEAGQKSMDRKFDDMTEVLRGIRVAPPGRDRPRRRPQ